MWWQILKINLVAKDIEKVALFSNIKMYAFFQNLRLHFSVLEHLHFIFNFMFIVFFLQTINRVWIICKNMVLLGDPIEQNQGGTN